MSAEKCFISSRIIFFLYSQFKDHWGHQPYKPLEQYVDKNKHNNTI